jgi:hypothetical protein
VLRDPKPDAILIKFEALTTIHSDFAPTGQAGVRRARQDDHPHTAQRLNVPSTTVKSKAGPEAETGGAYGHKKDGHYEGRTRDLGVSRMKAISTTL